MGCSSFYHLCYIKSEFYKNLLSRLDYSGIIILIMGSSIPPHYYPFACQNTHKERNIFLVLICSISFLCFFAILAPFFQKPKWKPLLTFLFIVLGLSAALPLYYLSMIVSDSTGYSKEYKVADMDWWAGGGALYIIGGIIYAKQIPERCYPRRFDFCGQSH